MAATDPVRRVRSELSETAVETNLSDALTRLADLPPQTETPYVTVYLHFDHHGSRPNKGPIEAWNEVQDEVRAYDFRSVEGKSLTGDLERITAYLEDEIEKSAVGVMIISNHGSGVFEYVEMGLPVEPGAALGPIPYLNRFARVVEDNPAYAIVALDQVDAMITLVSSDVAAGTLSVESSGYPRRQSTGGLNQQNYKNRANERIEAFVKVVADELRTAMEALDVRRFILVSDNLTGPVFQAALHDTIRDKMIGSFRADKETPFKDLLEEATPIALAYERKREAEVVTAISDAVGSDNRGAAGAIDVLMALAEGRVSTLAMVADFSEPGWADYTMPIYGIGIPPEAHPAGGEVNNIVAVPLEEEMVRQALLTGAEIEIIHDSVPVAVDSAIPDAGEDAPRTSAADHLDSLGGVGALLRW